MSARMCPRCLENVADEQAHCPFCDGATVLHSDRADNTFTDIQHQLFDCYQEVTKDRDRLRDFISTLHVNAIRCTPNTRSAFVSFIVSSTSDVIRGASTTEVLQAFNALPTCSDPIAATPELFEACKAWIDWMDGDGISDVGADRETEMLDAMRAALAKATGPQS